MKTLVFIAIEYVICTAAVLLAWFFPYWPLWIFTFVVVSTRQHALWMIFHDSVHFHLAKNRRLNDNLSYGLLSVPLMLPLHTFRDIHLLHHKHVGTPLDPERHFLYRFQSWDYRPLTLKRLVPQILGDIFLVHNFVGVVLPLRTMLSPSPQGLRLLGLKPYPEYYLYLLGLVGMMTLLFLEAPAVFWHVMSFWFLPLFTLAHLWHKLRSFAEHSWDEASPTYSWQVGWLGRATIWPYHINFHREHHQNPTVPWHQLPVQFAGVSQKKGRDFKQLLWSGKF